MKQVRLFRDQEVQVDLTLITKHLNNICKSVTFVGGQTEFELPDEQISYPNIYDQLSPSIKFETKDDFLVFLFTRRRYDNNYFFEASENLAIISIFAWEHLTTLPLDNGVVFFIADFFALEIDNSFRHYIDDETPKPECIYDFGWNKTGIDAGMRSALICPDCLDRISKNQLSKWHKDLFEDLRKILNDLGNASKWETNINEYWGAKTVNQSDVMSIVRDQIFICYSHVDGDWLVRFKTHLKPFERESVIHVWDDTRLRTGQEWRREIELALQKTKIAVLLVSADFLASDFIATNELPPLLAAAKEGGAKIMPIILKPCTFSRCKELARFQSVNPPSRTLLEMSEGERERIWLQLTEEILDEVKQQ